MAMKYDEIKCPKCGALVYCGDGHPWVTCWGEKPHDMSCEGCEHEFQVRECVVRDYTYVLEESTPAEALEITSDLLSLADVVVTPEECGTWTPEQREQADAWAAAIVCHASDNTGVKVPEKPSFLPPSETDKRLDSVGSKKP